MNYEKITSHEKHEENPFIQKAIGEIHPVKKYINSSGSDKKAILQAVDSNGEPVGHTTFVRQIEVDEQQFAKLYLSQFSSFWDLNKSAIKVFGYILNALKPSKDEFYLSMNKCMEYTKYKQRNAINSGISQLIKAEIIAKSVEPNWYFINPMVIFNGNRLSFVNSYMKKKNGNEDGQQKLES